MSYKKSIACDKISKSITFTFTAWKREIQIHQMKVELYIIYQTIINIDRNIKKSIKEIDRHSYIKNGEVSAWTM